MEMIDSGSSAADTTPKRDSSKRSSAEYMRAMASPVGNGRANDAGSPETPSPPYHARRSSTSLGYFTSPLHPRAGAILSKNDTSSPNDNAYTVPHSPGVPRSRLMPPTTPKSRNAEVFLSPPPKLKSPSVYKDNGKPIREISNGLKARLNYALVKLQNGWVDKTLPELENELDESHQRIPHQQQHLRPRYRGSYHNEYASVEEEVAYISSHSDEEGDNGNSAHLAFLKALSSPKKKHRQNAPPTSPLQWSAREKKSPSSKKQQPPSEVEAIETLMSLSSPQRTHPPQELTVSVPGRNSDHNDSNDNNQVSSQQPQSTFPSSPSSSSSSARSNSDRLSQPLNQRGIGRMVRPLMVPNLQTQSSASELSPDSTTSEKHSNQLRYAQHQTDIETDVEDSAGDEDDEDEVV